MRKDREIWRGKVKSKVEGSKSEREEKEDEG